MDATFGWCMSSTVRRSDDASLCCRARRTFATDVNQTVVLLSKSRRCTRETRLERVNPELHVVLENLRAFEHVMIDGSGQTEADANRLSCTKKSSQIPSMDL